MPELLHTFTDGNCDRCDRYASIHDRTGLCENCYGDLYGEEG